MLHYTTIDSTTLELLKRLLAIPYFSNMYLAGGTSLALSLSVDTKCLQRRSTAFSRGKRHSGYEVGSNNG